MTEERIESWALLMQQDGFRLFITSSRAVLDLLMDRMPEMEEVTRFDAVPAGAPDAEALATWQDELIKHLEIWPPAPGPLKPKPRQIPPKFPEVKAPLP